MTYPRCFASQKEFDGWYSEVRRANEQVTPCSDCTMVFEQRMRILKRCDKSAVRQEFNFFPLNKKRACQHELLYRKP